MVTKFKKLSHFQDMNMKFDLNYFKMMTSLLFKYEADFTTSTRY